jgi:hypothetical protein
MSKQAYPLQWPAGWKRTDRHSRENGRFNRKERQYRGDGEPTWMKTKILSVYEASQRVLDSLQKMGISENDVVLSTNVPLRLDGRPRSDQREPDDPGVAVYWHKRGQPMRCIAIDRYNLIADNIAAVAATLEAMRAIERHGGAEILERTFTGFAALSDGSQKPWREVLGLTTQDLTIGGVDDAFRRLAKIHHPDAGGNAEQFRELSEAREAARQELGAA